MNGMKMGAGILSLLLLIGGPFLILQGLNIFDPFPGLGTNSSSMAMFGGIVSFLVGLVMLAATITGNSSRG